MVHKAHKLGQRKMPSAARREQIAQATLSLIAQDGLRGLSMAAVARRLGLVPSAIYRHFRSKDDLIDATLELIGARLERNVQMATAEQGDPLEALGRLLMLHVELIRDARAIPRIILSDDVQWQRPERKRRIHALLARYLGHVADLVRAGQAAGRIRPEIEPDTVALMFLGLIQPAGVLWHLTDGRFDVTRQVRRAWDVLVEAIAVAPAGPAGGSRGREG